MWLSNARQSLPVRVLHRYLHSFPARKQAFTEKLDSGPDFFDFINARGLSRPQERLPSWLKTNTLGMNENVRKIRQDLQSLKLNTVCEEARCPNRSECWSGSDRSKATATIMLLGNECTRGCRFCSVKTSKKPAAPDPNEPENTAKAINTWGVGYIVLTTVDRDDLADGGANHIAKTVQLVKQKNPETLVEALVGDFRGDLKAIQKITSSGLDVFAHNIETVESLTPLVRDSRAMYKQSLHVLKSAKDFVPSLYTKTSIMLGLGETDAHIECTLRDLRMNNVDIVTLGQYIRPTKRHLKVAEFIKPEKFDYWKSFAESLGFMFCASGPLVRSSYKAGEFFLEKIIRKKVD